MKRSPLKRTKPLRARKPMKKVNRRRREARSLEQFGSREFRTWIHGLPCVVSGYFGRNIEQAHVVSRARQGTWRDTIPLWVVLHHEYHDIGQKRFEEKYGVSLRLEADIIQKRWEARKA